jgi:uncharacterized protein (DUF4415 family)
LHDLTGPGPGNLCVWVRFFAFHAAIRATRRAALPFARMDMYSAVSQRCRGAALTDEGGVMNVEQQLSPTPVRRARPPKRKTRITIYLDDEVLKEFRALSERSGTGYQTLINAALRSGLDDPMAGSALI